MEQFHLPPRSHDLPSLPQGGFDSHAHLDGKPFRQDLPEAIQRARDVGMTGIINVFLGPLRYENGKDMFAAYPEVAFALGVHPCDGHEAPEDYLERMEAAFKSDSRLKALGEIGLDYHWKDCPRPVQEASFKAQLRLARKLDVPVVIHSRDAFADTIKILDAEGFARYPLLWHCFGGDAHEAGIIVGKGWHLSVPGPVTYPKNESLREALKSIPLDRLLIESDCPYLTPQKYRGKRNEPAYCAYTAIAIAEALGLDAGELWKRTGDNTRRFFGLLEQVTPGQV